MNYLAHAYFSNNDPELLIGNFIADHVRGNRLEVYAPGIVEGIRLHRRIDAFTDAHPAFRDSKRLFYEGFERYSGILVDIYFDHLLAKHFHRFSDVSLPDFSKHVYEVYARYQHLLPTTSSSFLDYVVKSNVYTTYADTSGIERVLHHLSQRIRHGVRLEKSLELFQANEHVITTAFYMFMADAIKQFGPGT